MTEIRKFRGEIAAQPSQEVRGGDRYSGLDLLGARAHAPVERFPVQEVRPATYSKSEQGLIRWSPLALALVAPTPLFAMVLGTLWGYDLGRKELPPQYALLASLVAGGIYAGTVALLSLVLPIAGVTAIGVGIVAATFTLAGWAWGWLEARRLRKKAGK